MEAFKVEKNVPYTSIRGRWGAKPKEYEMVKETMKKLEKNDSFSIPANGIKFDTVKNWIQMIAKDINNIFPPNIREKNPHVFRTATTRDAEGKETSLRIWRVQ